MRSGVLGAILGVTLFVACVETGRTEEKPDGKKADGEHKSKVAELFDKLDKDKSHKLTADEFKELHALIAGKDESVSAAKFEGYLKDLTRDAGKVDLFKGALDLSIYTIVVFLILFTILRVFAWGPIAAGLDKREQSIARDRKDADNAKKEAAQMRTSLEAERARANAEVRGMIDKARSDAEAIASERESQGKAALAAERNRMKRELEVSSAQARKEVLEQGAQLATLLSAKVIKKNLNYEDHRALIDEALNEFRAAASARKHDIESATA